MSTAYPTAYILRTGITAVLVALFANTLARLVIGAVLPLSQDFQPFGLIPILIFTLVFTGIGVGVLLLVYWFVTNPIRIYNWIGLLALVFSVLPNLAGASNPEAVPMGGEGSDYLTLIIFHIVAAISFLGVINLRLRKAHNHQQVDLRG